MSKELAKTYAPKAIEEKLYERWCENKYFHAEVDRSRKPFTTVMPPPNITGKRQKMNLQNPKQWYLQQKQKKIPKHQLHQQK